MITLLLSGCLQMQVAGAGIQRETIDGAAALRKSCLTTIYNVSRHRHFCSRTQAQLAHIKQLQVSCFYLRSTKIFKSSLPALYTILHRHICVFTLSTSDFLFFLNPSRCVYLFTWTPDTQITDISKWPQLKTSHTPVN